MLSVAKQGRLCWNFPAGKGEVFPVHGAGDGGDERLQRARAPDTMLYKAGRPGPAGKRCAMAVRTFLIKPASGMCNMRCRYCFYTDEVQTRSGEPLGLISREITRALICKGFSGLSRGDSVSFLFQGGEPTLAGLGYFQYFTDTVDEINTARVPVQYAIQSNGLMMDGAWTEFLRDHHFLVGLSLDGTKDLHDNNRVDAQGRGTWNRAAQSAARLQSKGVPVNFLCVVTKQLARSPQKVYATLKKLGGRYLQFIPCLDPVGAPRGAMPYSLLPEEYGHFLCTLFDLWYQDLRQGQCISIRYFEDLVQMMLGLPPSTCATNGCCGTYYVVEADGSVYPCDFFALDEWKMGYIQRHSLEELDRSQGAVRFMQRSRERLAPCGTCPWSRLCSGGCKRDWHEKDGIIQNYYCQAFQTFYEYAARRLSLIASSLR